MNRRLVPAAILSLVIVALAAGVIFTPLVCAQTAPPAAPATAPQPADVAAAKVDPKTGKPNERFMLMHEKFLARAKEGDVGLLFLGDSITEAWTKHAALWDDHFGKYKPANFGIGGDRTQHVLWRIENGELDGIKPKAIVLMIGTNNSAADPADKIAGGIEKIVKTARDKTGAKILLLGIFPRGETPEKAAKQRETIKAVNEQIKKLDDGGKTVRYLDLSEKFINGDGTISKDIMPDYLHLSSKGYELWANALDEPVKQMMGE